MDDAGSWPPDAYRRRRAALAASACGPGRRPSDVDYTESENRTWAEVLAALVPAWERHASARVLASLDRLALPRDRVPQLREVNDRLIPATGFAFEAVPGLVPKEEFFGALARRRFLSTQYVRWGGSPLYTEEPDVIHEVVGHAHLLVDAALARLHEQAGAATVRLQEASSRQFVADVFWFSGEFGVVAEAGQWRAYGAGLLSSVGELDAFSTEAVIVPLDVTEMGTLPYRIDRYQPRLFGAGSVDEVLEVVGGFFATCTDGGIADRLRTVPRPTRDAAAARPGPSPSATT